MAQIRNVDNIGGYGCSQVATRPRFTHHDKVRDNQMAVYTGEKT